MIRSREMKETVKQLTVTVLILTMIFGRCVTAFAFADRNTDDSRTGLTAAAVQTAVTSGPADPSQQTVLSASQGNGILKSGGSWLDIEAVGTDKPDRICFIDCSDGPQTVDGTRLSDWNASGDNSVRCYLVSDEDEVTLYIAFNEPEGKKAHTGSSFNFWNHPVYLREVTRIDGLELLDASSLTSAYGMFLAMESLQEIDLSFLTDSRLTNMISMFCGCSSLTNLDMSGFDTSAVRNMCGMFEECSSLKSLDVSGFDTSAVTDMHFMFACCNSLMSLDVSGFDTSAVTDMCCMFDSCSSLTSLDVSGFDTSAATDLSCMFGGCSGLTSLDVSGFDTSGVRDMYLMFGDCSSLTSLDVSGFDTTAVTNMRCMFEGCSGLTSLDVSGFDTSSVTDMYGMFEHCSSLKNLDMSGFDTSAVTVMYGMFGDCSSLTSLDVSGFNTSAVTNMGCMFWGCRSLENLDLSGFSISPSIYSSGMFNGCDRLYTVKIGEEFHPAWAVFPWATDARKRAISPSIDGRWYSVDVPGTSYTPAEMNAAPAGTYQAMPLATPSTPSSAPKSDPKPSPEPDPSPSPKTSPEPDISPSPKPQYEEHNVLGSDYNAVPVKTGTWNDPVTDGTWAQGTDGKWTYTTNAVFKNTWGYILNPYASDEANRYGWFWFDENGKMVTGWVEIGGKWYYLNTDSSKGCLGMCLINTTTPDGHKVDENGARVD